MTLSGSAADALCLVELRGFEPLTPCMPLTSQPLAPQRASTRRLISVLLSTQIAMKRYGAGCGDVRFGCWQIAGGSPCERTMRALRSRWSVAASTGHSGALGARVLFLGRGVGGWAQPFLCLLEGDPGLLGQRVDQLAGRQLAAQLVSLASP